MNEITKANNQMNYLKNLLEQTKKEIDSLTNNIDEEPINIKKYNNNYNYNNYNYN